MAVSHVIRRTFTLTSVEGELLQKIAKHRHPTDSRVESLTLRELIREEYARIKRMEQAQETVPKVKEKGQQHGIV